MTIFKLFLIIGDFSDGKKNGEGILFNYPYNFQFLGYESDDFTHELNSNIEVFLGKFKNEKLNGNGRVYNYQKLFYEGGLKNDTLNGTGIQYYVDTTKIQYKGEFKTGKYNGRGTLYDENGNVIYDGNWSFGDYSD